MNSTHQTLLRSVLKIGSGALIARGYIGDGQAEELIGAILAVVSILWGVWHRCSPHGPQQDRGDDQRGAVGVFPVLVIAAGMTVLSGCALQRVVEIDPKGKLTKYTGFAVLNKSALEGLAVGKTSPKGNTLFSLEKGNTETQVDAILAMGQVATKAFNDGMRAVAMSQGVPPGLAPQLPVGPGSSGGTPEQARETRALPQAVYIPPEMLQAILARLQTNAIPAGGPGTNYGIPVGGPGLQ